MRSLSSPTLSALQASALPVALLVEMELSTPLYLCTGALDLVWSGSTYWGTKGLGAINAIADTPSDIKAMSFTLSGVPATQVALVLGDAIQGKTVRIRSALFDPNTYQVLDVRLIWQGVLDVVSIEDGAPTSTIQVTAEHAAIDLIRSRASYYSDAEQRRLCGGDPSLQYIADQTEQRIVWPAASYGRR